MLDVLADDKGSGMASMDIVKVIYKNYPENLWEPAERGIRQILEKLKLEGKVGGETLWALSGRSSL